MIDQRKRIFAVNLWILDLALTTASFFLAYFVRLLFDLQDHSLLQLSVYLGMLAIILPTWAILLPLFRVYSDLTLPPIDQIWRLTKAVGVAWLVSGVIELFAQVPLNRIIVLLMLVLNYILLVAYRVLRIRLKKHTALDVRHVAIVGSGSSAREVARKIEEHRNWGLRLVGVFDLADVRPLLEAGGVDELIIASEKVAGKEELEVFNDTFLLCEELGITARFVLNFFPHSIARMELSEFDGLPLLSFSTTPSNEIVLFCRRILDIGLALFLSVFAIPLIAICAVIIKLTSRGPVLFRQERCGLHGRPFIMYKLRSMVDEAEQLRFELEYLNEMDGPVFKSSRDPRVTAIGRFMRRFSIDELPQIFNVLRGDMSLVGPRPPLPQEVARYERWQRRRLSMKPGLTCLWQVSGRNEIGFQDWMKLDLSYIDNWSLLLDLKILLKTVPVVLLGRGAK
jgi:exopolysaccharide biosynthesis polyprenyl glycosylphosphotransferase